MKCERCGGNHQGLFGSGRFCSIGCSNKRERTQEVKDRISKSMRASGKAAKAAARSKGAQIVPRRTKSCKGCKSHIIGTSKQLARKTYCTHECFVRYGNCGGARHGSGRGDSGYYRDIYCGSTYELAWVIWNLDHNYPVDRFDGKLEGEGITYVPDFYDSKTNTIIEIKGYYTPLVDKKTKLAESLGYTVIVLYKDDLKECFEYVKKKYGTNKLKELYSDYKPKYEFVCKGCGVGFTSDTKYRSHCSKSCAVKNRRKN